MELLLEIAFENDNALPDVPATFGPVIVHEPLVEPKPVITQEVVLRRPHDRPLCPVNAPVTLSDVPVAAPITGVVSVGDVPKTANPVPVSSLSTPANCAEVVDANWDSGFEVSAFPVPVPQVGQAMTVPVTVMGEVAV